MKASSRGEEMANGIGSIARAVIVVALLILLL